MGHICSTNRTKRKRPVTVYQVLDLPASQAPKNVGPDGCQLSDPLIVQKIPPRYNVPKLLNRSTVPTQSVEKFKLRRQLHQRNQNLKYNELYMKYFLRFELRNNFLLEEMRPRKPLLSLLEAYLLCKTSKKPRLLSLGTHFEKRDYFDFMYLCRKEKGVNLNLLGENLKMSMGLTKLDLSLKL